MCKVYVITQLPALLFPLTDISKALVITELGASRELANMEVVNKNFRTVAEPPIRVHG